MPVTLISSHAHPATSPRTAEAIRIAAGVAAWKKTIVLVLFRGLAGYSLTEYVDDYIDEDNFTRYLPILAELGRPFYIEETFRDRTALEHSPWNYKFISTSQTAALLAESTYAMQF